MGALRVQHLLSSCGARDAGPRTRAAVGAIARSGGCASSCVGLAGRCLSPHRAWRTGNACGSAHGVAIRIGHGSGGLGVYRNAGPLYCGNEQRANVARRYPAPSEYGGAESGGRLQPRIRRQWVPLAGRPHGCVVLHIGRAVAGLHVRSRECPGSRYLGFYAGRGDFAFAPTHERD
jgi:hypothetical protein